MRREVPEPWASAMVAAGITDPRYTDPRPSMSQLAQRIGVHTSTVSSMVFGERETDQATIDAAAAALGVPAATVAEWVGRTEANPYRPPSSASLLTADEREHVDWIIRRLTRDRTTTQTTDEREVVEQVEGVQQLGPAGLRGEIRATTRALQHLVDTDRRLTADEQELVLLYTQKLARLQAALDPAPEPRGQAADTG